MLTQEKNLVSAGTLLSLSPRSKTKKHFRDSDKHLKFQKPTIYIKSGKAKIQIIRVGNVRKMLEDTIPCI